MLFIPTRETDQRTHTAPYTLVKAMYPGKVHSQHGCRWLSCKTHSRVDLQLRLIMFYVQLAPLRKQCIFYDYVSQYGNDTRQNKHSSEIQIAGRRSRRRTALGEIELNYFNQPLPLKARFLLLYTFYKECFATYQSVPYLHRF